MTKQENDIYYTCSLIDFIGRETKNERSLVVDVLGESLIEKIFSFADVYHCENINKIVDEFVEMSGLEQGNFDNVDDCLYNIPSYWKIGKVYQRLISKIISEQNLTDDNVPSLIFKVFSSEISDGIQNYNCAWYYSTPDDIYYTYLEEN